MKKIISFLLITLIAVPCVLCQTITKNYDFKNITSVTAEALFFINVTKGNSSDIEVICPSYLNDYIRVTASSGTINFGLNLPRNFRSPKGKDVSGKIIVNMQMAEIKKIDLSGASCFNAIGEYETNDLNINVHGVSKISNLDIRGKLAYIVCSGASILSASCKFDDINIHGSGCSKINIDGDIDNIITDISGATKFVYNGNTSSIKLQLSGVSNADLTGTAQKIDINCSGGSIINAKDLKSVEASVVASGVSKVNLCATGILNVNANTSSKFVYNGNASYVKLQLSGVSSADLIGTAQKIDMNCLGSSIINAKDLKSVEASVVASGISKVNVYATDILDIKVDASSVVNYYGNPKQIISKPENIRKGE